MNKRKQTICLNVICFNEEKHIGLLLASVKDLIDYWVIADGGSTDNTRLIIENALEGIPGELIDLPWEGFGPTRTKAIEAAKGKADFILLADADYSIITHSELPELTADCYLAKFEGAISWRLPMLLKDGIDWYWDGQIHETLYAKQEYMRENIDALTYIHRATDQDLNESLVRNLGLLLKDWEEAPSARTAFYLGNTYCDLGEITQSAHWYKKRIEMGDASDEVFFSQYQMARQLKDVDGLLTAYYMGNHRVEPLYYLARMYRERGMHEIALIFAEIGIQLPFPDQDTMFVDLELYIFGILYEFAAAAYHVEGRTEDALTMYAHILTLNNCPKHIEKACKKALKV